MATGPRSYHGTVALCTVFSILTILYTFGLQGPRNALFNNDGSTSRSSILESPFKNTLAMIRWNSLHPERMPLLAQYAPFFHDIHFSMPDLVSDQGEGFHNLTHDSEPDSLHMQGQVARTMQHVLNNEPEIEGLLYFHFDAWIDPLAFSKSNMENIWFPDSSDGDGGGPRFICLTEATISKYEWWGWGHGYYKDAVAASTTVKEFGMDYVLNPEEFCLGWSDIYYIPRRFFADFIFLSEIFMDFPVWHEVAIPTILHIIDQTRSSRARSVLDRIGDCWGSCCASSPDVQDVLWNRCGHRLDYLDEPPVDAHYGRLAEEAAMLGHRIAEPAHGSIRGKAPGRFVVETHRALNGRPVSNDDRIPSDISDHEIRSTDKILYNWAVERDSNFRKADRLKVY
ncbi:hypothetical protein B7494_g7573 [Chlorociboria aeruginascens]|nr:hypothetical protein B7494_g7573 [Chlorociboria aeruginascens]